MNVAYIYLQLYRLFDEITPLKSDCGKFCNKACCQGDDSGMYLFPGEKKVFELLNPSWARIEQSDFTYQYNDKKKSVPILFCDCDCDRYQRPLACRIFPLTPYLKDGKLEIITDPRAKAVCPIANTLKASELEYDFIENVKKAFCILMSSKEFRAFMKSYSEYLDEYLKFYN